MKIYQLKCLHFLLIKAIAKFVLSVARLANIKVVSIIIECMNNLIILTFIGPLVINVNLLIFNILDSFIILKQDTILS